MYLHITLMSLLLMPTVIATVTVFGQVKIHSIDVRCPSQEERENAIQNITASVQAILQNGYLLNSPNSCGDGLWHKVTSLDMSDPLQQCPSAWREYNESGFRTCRSPIPSSANCSGALYTTSQQYSKVCGRAIGYQIGATDAFWHSTIIDSYYVYGISVTHGQPRNHIWTFASGYSEGDGNQQLNCPCSDPSSSENRYPPSFVGGNYYCESGNPTSTITAQLYSSDPLWDGQQCEDECCSNGKSPPWFSVELSNTTTDDIEVRICNPHGNDDDVGLELLELYIQ